MRFIDFLKLIQKKGEFMSSLLENIKLKIFLILLFLMIFFPMTLEFLYIKAILFGVVLVLTLFLMTIKHKIIKIDKQVLLMLVLFIGYSFFSSLYGIISNNPGALKQMQIYVLWPLIYILILFNFDYVKNYLKLYKMIKWSINLIILYGFYMIISHLGILDLGLINLPSFEETVVINGWIVSMRYPGLNSVAYGIGFILGIIFIMINNKKNNFHAILYTLVLLIFTFITGRRVYFLLVLIIFFIISNLKVHPFIKNQKKIIYISLISGMALSIFFLGNWLGIEINKIIDYGFSAFDMKEFGNEQRFLQIKYLVEGWLESPITFLIGHGHGSYSDLIIRSYEMPWAYEVFYIALLFQTGLVGLLIYITFFIFIVYKSLKLIKYNYDLTYYILPLTTGLISLLIASVSNPYLMRFDGLWAIFILLGVVNHFSNNKIILRI